MNNRALLIVKSKRLKAWKFIEGIWIKSSLMRLFLWVQNCCERFGVVKRVGLLEGYRGVKLGYLEFVWIEMMFERLKIDGG